MSDNTIEEIVDTYKNLVYRIAMNQVKNPADADDIFQEVFLRYVRMITKYSSDETIFCNKQHEKAWFIRVTINCCKTMLTSAWRRKIMPLEEDLPYLMPEEKDVYGSVNKLPTLYRTVIHLYYFEELSVSEIGKVLDRKESTVREQLTRGRRLLKKYLKGDFDYV